VLVALSVITNSLSAKLRPGCQRALHCAPIVTITPRSRRLKGRPWHVVRFFHDFKHFMQLIALAGKCPVESCKFSMANIGICACAQCDGQGILIIDGSSGGAGIWRIICNSCSAVFTLQPERKISRVVVVPAAQWGGCENCGSNLLSVETTKDYELPFGGHQYEGNFVGFCAICD
jgi:hypothetical protein